MSCREHATSPREAACAKYLSDELAASEDIERDQAVNFETVHDADY
jgi:hypothetical protein